MLCKRNFRLVMLLVSLFATQSARAGHVETQGDVLVVLIPGAAYGMTFYYDDPAGRREFYQSFLATSITTHVLKTAVGKPRPDGSDNRSFPSGHTSASFQGAAFIHRRYGWQKAVLPYLAATYVGYTRVEANKHDWTDVGAGALLGIASTFWLASPRPGTQHSLHLDKNGVGYSFYKQF